MPGDNTHYTYTLQASPTIVHTMFVHDLVHCTAQDMPYYWQRHPRSALISNCLFLTQETPDQVHQARLVHEGSQDSQVKITHFKIDAYHGTKSVLMVSA